MSFFTNYETLCRRKGLSPSGAAKLLGIPSSNVTQWKHGSTPRAEVLADIAQFFHVPVSYLLYGGEEEKKPLVNNDEELTEMLEAVRDDPDLRMLFSVTKGATKEDIQRAIKIIQMLKNE